MNYKKALSVAESLRSELAKTDGFYKKSLRVLESIKSDTTRSTIKEMVKAEFGKYAPYHRVFKKINSVEEAKLMVKAIKESTSKDRPTIKTGLRRKPANESTNLQPVHKDERRVGLYS
jgi:hypothetical protein